MAYENVVNAELTPHNIVSAYIQATETALRDTLDLIGDAPHPPHGECMGCFFASNLQDILKFCQSVLDEINNGE